MTMILEVNDLHVQFNRPEGTVHAVNGVTFQVQAGEWIGVLGESGSGKSVSLLSILKLLGDSANIPQGQARFAEHDLLTMSERKLRRLRGKDIGIIFQNLANGLDPLMRIGQQVIEPMLEHNICTKREAKRRAIALLAEMGLSDPESQFNRYPFELSGGMRQRVMMAVALACNPKLLIADEPTTALDTTVSVQVLSTLREACERRNMTTIMVTHDLGVAANVCDRVLVMYGGMIMEDAEIDGFIKHPAHPYTLGLKASIFSLKHRDIPLKPIAGSAKTWWLKPLGCPFAERCPFAIEKCWKVHPDMVKLSEQHEVACHRSQEMSTLVG